MKNVLIPMLAGLVLSCAHSVAQSQEFKEKVNKEFTGANTLVIYNINGFIDVEGTNSDKVSFEVDKRITAKEQDVLEEGKRELKLVIEQKGDTVMAYIAEPFDSRPKQNYRNWNNGESRQIEYDYTLDFTVKVPRQMNVRVSTVNRGDVTVKDVTGPMRVRNVNGGIRLTNARGATDVHTINGNVEANYLASPPEKSSYYTLNGDIKVSYPANLSADLQFKTFQGDFYTDFPETEVLPAQVVKNEERKGDKTVYKLNKTTSIRIGNGGKTLRFETFNGSVYIKKQS